MTIRKLVGTLENKGPYIDQATGFTGTGHDTLTQVIHMQLNP